MVGGEDGAEVDAEQPLVDGEEGDRHTGRQHPEQRGQVDREVREQQRTLQRAVLQGAVRQRPHARHVQVQPLQREQREEQEGLRAADQTGQPLGGAGLVLGPDQQVGGDVGVESLVVGVGVVAGVLVLPPPVAHPDARPGDPPGHLAGPA